MGRFEAGQGMSVVGWTTSGGGRSARPSRWGTWQKGICRFGVSWFLPFAEEGGWVRGFFPRVWSTHFLGRSLLGLLALLVNSKKRIGHSLFMWITPMRIPILDHSLSCFVHVLDISPYTTPYLTSLDTFMRLAGSINFGLRSSNASDSACCRWRVKRYRDSWNVIIDIVTGVTSQHTLCCRNL